MIFLSSIIGERNFLTSNAKVLDYAKENLDAARKNLATPFEHATELAEKSARLEQLDRELNIDKADEVIIDNDEEDHTEDRDRGENLAPKKPKSPKH